MKYDLGYFQRWLDKYMNFERKPDARLFRLDKTERLAEIFGHPERSYKTYHVTGSKGKGSVARMLACVLAESEPKSAQEPVGVYASPHVYDFRERICTAKGFLPDEVYAQTVAEFTGAVDGLPNASSCGSWFELNAAFAFLAFHNAGCRHAVFEVGMGGRLDATNIIRPEICLISRIELEHTEFLGDTLEKIAGEKAGIIKEHTPVVVAEQKNESVKNVFRQKAQEKAAPIYFVEDLAQIKNLRYENGRLCFQIVGKIFSRPLEVKLKMLAKVQAKNAMQVAVAAKILNPELPEEAIERGLLAASLPGRFEVRKGVVLDRTHGDVALDSAHGDVVLDDMCGDVVLDGAHTLESVRETLETFNNLYPGKERNLLFAIAEGKDVEHIVPLFKGKFTKIFVTRPGDFKKSDLETVRQIFDKNAIAADFDGDYVSQIKKALLSSKNTPLLVTGSFYLLDEVNKITNLPLSC